MKYLKKLSLLFVILIATKSNAQSSDSAAVTEKVGELQNLVLSNKQRQETITAYKQLQHDRDSVNTLNLTPENRGIFLAQIQAKYDNALQSILNTEQRKVHNDRQKATQQAFEQRMKQQKIKYTLLNNQ